MATTDTAIQGLAPQGIYDRFIRPALPEPEIFEKPRNLLWGFVGIHVVYLLGLLPNIVAGTVEGDLPLYRRWAIAALDASALRELEFGSSPSDFPGLS